MIIAGDRRSLQDAYGATLVVGTARSVSQASAITSGSLLLPIFW